jgi:hypothetical protein
MKKDMIREKLLQEFEFNFTQNSRDSNSLESKEIDIARLKDNYDEYMKRNKIEID